MDSTSQQLADTWIEVDKSVIRANIRGLGAIARKNDKGWMLMVKANAYGHGLVEMSLLAQDEGAVFLGVTGLDDAVLLRDNGVTTPILLFGEPRPEFIPLLFAHAVTPVVSSMSFLRVLASQAPAGSNTSFHLKINTGLNRFGIRPEEMDECIAFLKEHTQLRLEGLLTHYSAADHDEATTERQLQAFLSCVQSCKTHGLKIPYVHASNSAGTAWLAERDTNLVRLGLSAYGLQPSDERHIDVRQAFIWKARLLSVSKVGKGESVGYGGKWRAEHDSLIGVVAVGYYNGFRRGPANYGFMLCKGARVPIVGNVMMNHTLIDVTGVPDVLVNEDIVLVGRQGEAQITFEEAGAYAGTINEEILTVIQSSIPRVYDGA